MTNLRQYTYSENLMPMHKIKWSVKNSGTNYVPFGFTIGQILSWNPIESASLEGAECSISLGAGSKIFLEKEDCDATYISVGNVDAKWGDHRIGRMLLEDMKRVQDFLKEANLDGLHATMRSNLSDQ